MENGKLKLVIQSLENDGLNVEGIVELYSEELSVADISDKLGLTPYEVNKVLYALQLRRKKKHRQVDYMTYLALLNEDGESKVLQQQAELQEELNFTYKALDVAEGVIEKQKLELNRRRKTDRLAHRNTQEMLETFAELKVLVKQKPILIQNRYTIAERNDLPYKGLLAIIGDLHFGEVVHKDEVTNNVYNYEIAKQRMRVFLHNIINNPRQSQVLTLVDLKDNIKGVIHGGKFNTEGGFIQSILEVVKLQVELYVTLSDVYEKVEVYSTGSNHERIDDIILFDKKYQDYGRLVDELVIMQLQALGITNVNISVTNDGLQLFEVNGAHIVAFHGDNIRTFKPYVDNQRSLLQDMCLSQRGKPYRHSINGHNHQFMVVANQYNGLTIQNGTAVGNTPYGIQSGMRSLTPIQSIVFVEVDGAIQDVKAVILS